MSATIKTELHGAIGELRVAYKLGHRDARHAAAELALSLAAAPVPPQEGEREAFERMVTDAIKTARYVFEGCQQDPADVINYIDGLMRVALDDRAALAAGRADEEAAVIDRLEKLLAGVAIALKGDELPLHRHSYHDLPGVAVILKMELDLYRSQAVPSQPAALSARKDWQRRAVEVGFEYWRASDAHGVTCKAAQAIELLEELLGVEVEITDAAPPKCSSCDDSGKIGDQPCPDCDPPAALPAEVVKGLLSKLMTAKIVIANLPELPGYNGSILTIDDTEAAKIAADLEELYDALATPIAAQPAAAEPKCEPGCFYYGTRVDCEACNPEAFPPAAPAQAAAVPEAEATLSDAGVLKVLDVYTKRIKVLEALAADPGEIAYQLTKRLVIDMPTARAAVDAAFKEMK